MDKILVWIAILFAIWTIYIRFENPSLTETQILLKSIGMYEVQK